MMVLSDTESDQRAEDQAECDAENNVTGSHGEGSGLDVAKVIGIDADSAKERRETAHVDTPVVRAVCACVDRAGLALRAIEEVMGEDARMDHVALRVADGVSVTDSLTVDQ